MNTPDLSPLYLPLAAAATGALSIGCVYAASYLNEKTHASRMSRVVGAIGRIAGDISQTLQAMPPSADPQAIKAAAIAKGISDIQARLPDTLKAVGADSDILRGMISGELGKLLASSPAVASVTPVVAPVVAAVAPVIAPAVVEAAEMVTEDALAATH